MLSWSGAHPEAHLAPDTRLSTAPGSGEFKLWSNLTLTNQKPCVFFLSFFLSFLLICFMFFFCFFKLLSFFLKKNPSVVGPGTPIPRPPQALQKGGEEVCSVCQRRANVSAIMSPPSSPLCPREKGGGRGGVSRLDTQSDSLHCIVADYCVMTNCCPEGCFPVN